MAISMFHEMQEKFYVTNILLQSYKPILSVLVGMGRGVGVVAQSH